MNPIELYYNLSEFNFEYIFDHKKLSFDSNVELEDLLKNNNIIFENQNGKIAIEKSNLPFSFFRDIIEFQEQIRLFHFLKPIIIFNYKETGEIYYSNKFDSELIPAIGKNDYLMSNSKTYLESLDFFKEKFNEIDSGFEFVDFYSDSSKTITFASISEKKRIKFLFSAAGVIEMDSNIDYSLKFDEFKALMTESKQYPVFIKKSLIKNLLNVEGNPYPYFFKKLDQIILEAKLDFNVYLHELSIDKIKADYKEYKQKYFASQNEILNKLTTQIIALPLSISGTVFAISRLDNKITPLLIVCFGLLCYIGYVSFLIKFYVRDIVALSKQSMYDYTYLSEQAFFIENKNELLYFSEIKTSIDERLKDLLNGLKAFTIIMWISSGLIIFYAINSFIKWDITEHLIQCIFIAVLPCSILGYIYSNILFKEKLLLKHRDFTSTN